MWGFLKSSFVLCVPVLAPLFVALLGGSPLRPKPSPFAKTTIYILEEPVSGSWCGYSSELNFHREAKALGVMVLGGAEFNEGELTEITLVQTDQTGDWAVNDVYQILRDELASIRRVISIIPDDLELDQAYWIDHGQPRLRSSRSRSLETGKPKANRDKWFQPPPIVNSLSEFPFYLLITADRGKIVSTGKECVSGRQR